MAEEDAPIKVVHHCRVSPNSRLSSPISLTLSAFDIPWTCIIGEASHQAQQILLYQFPNTYTNDIILHQVIPSLKTSLSLALDKFYPYASKLVFPPLPETPRILYTDGDSVLFTVAESTMDFGELVGDQMKDAKLFHALIPNLSQQIQSSEDDETWIFPHLLAIQVTVFPESRGLCIGIHVNHTIGDGTGFAYFLKSWASICGTKDSQLVPFLNRDVIEDATGLQTLQLWKEWSLAFPRGPPGNNNKPPPPPPSAAESVRATFILSKTNINRLKHWIIMNQQQPTLSNISSFAAACAFIWVCFLKSKQEEVDDHKKIEVFYEEEEEECEFLFTADVRTRLKTPAPETFFGNCVVPCSIYIKKNDLLGKHGIVYAATTISEKVKELDDGGAAVRSAVETWLSYTKGIQPERLFTVAGSPRMAVYDMDFGWGRPKKCEIGHIDVGSIVSLSQSRSDENGGLEIGVALERTAMDKFNALFQGLEESFII